MTLREWAWRRHEHPASGWSRVLGYWLLVWAVYRGDRRTVALAAGFLAVNPVVFPPPADGTAWMTRGVRAERAWLAAGRPGRWRSVLNALNSVAFAYGLLAAHRRQPLRAAVAALAVTLLKLAVVADLVREYEPGGGR